MLRRQNEREEQREASQFRKKLIDQITAFGGIEAIQDAKSGISVGKTPRDWEQCALMMPAFVL